MVNRAIIGGMFAILFLFVAFSGVSVFAEESASVDFSIDASDAVLQLSVPNSANIPLSPVSSSGDFGSTTLEINVGTNNETGYTLTMSPESSDENHITSLISSNDFRIDTLSPTDPASTGYTQSSFTANRWGYRLSNSSNYYPVPTELAPDSWVTDVNTNNTTHYLTLAAKVDGTQPADTYETTLNFEAVANPRIGKHNISFNGNGADGGTAMSNLVVYAGETENLPENTYTLTGYRFTGWSTSQSGSGMYYGDGSSYSVPSDSFNTNVTLYAQWVPSSTPEVVPPSTSGVTIARAYEIAYSAMHKGMYEEQTEGEGDYALVNSWPPTSESYKGYDVRFAIQDMTTEICNSVTVIGDSLGALDIRDNHIYSITKAQDGRCWMQDDLRLNPLAQGTTMSSADTNAPDAALTNLLNNNNPGVTGWSTNMIRETNSLDLWNIRPEMVTLYEGTISTYDSAIGHNWERGILYNYCAISAGTYCYNGGNPDIADTLIDSPYDLCPFGWRLPSGDYQTGEFGRLESSYIQPGATSSSLVVAALHLTGAGYYNYSDLYHEGSINYWSATYYGSAHMRNYYYWGYKVNTDAIAARCIVK